MNHVQDRRKSLRLHDGPVIARPEYGRLDEVPRPREDFAAIEKLRPRSARGGHGRTVLLGCSRIDQWAHERPRLEWVTDANLPVGVHQALLEVRRAARMHQDAACRGAALPGGAGRAKHDCGHSKIKTRALVDGHCVIAAELEETLREG